ncbi:unnamed protein product [Strongylus vulgaris]|uniref:Uncharacterized protein n=1 Tax=Strongylus vulgaris TaxID=40348 RepID=A0A3P7KC35_STRVU|nr:unnamed protein product [Strongylus vulgaris]
MVKKRSAENTESSTAIEGGVAAKQPRLDVNAAKTFPKRNGGPQSAPSVTKPVNSVRSGLIKKKIPPKRASYNEWQNGPGYFSGSGSAGRDRFRQRPRPFQDTRPREIPPLFPTRSGGPPGVSPWSRPPFQEDVRTLEQVMRRAAHDNSSSFEAARQVERLGLGPAMGTMLSSVAERVLSKKENINLALYRGGSFIDT